MTTAPIPRKDGDITSPLVFTTTPYRPDGGFAPLSLGRLFLVTGGVGVGLGLLVGWLGQWVYVALLFPLLMALGQGFVGALMVHLDKLRNAWMASLVGLLVGCISVAALHYQNYQRFQQSVDRQKLEKGERIRQRLREQDLERLPPRLRIQLQPDLQLAREAEAEARALDSFPAYLDLLAQRGVVLGIEGWATWNLGYIGSYIYWGLELLLVVSVTAGLMSLFAGDPFCRGCERWKELRELGTCPIHGSEEASLAALEQGQLTHFSDNRPVRRTRGFQLSVFVCPRCGEAGTVDLWVQNSGPAKGRKARRSALTTYPGVALPPLQALCQTTKEG